MSTLTSRLGLYKPAASGVELVNVVTDLNNNLDSLDAKVGAFACTSGTRPGAPYDGQMIRETDTGKLMIWAGSPTNQWQQALFNTAGFTNPITITSGDMSLTSGAFKSTKAAAGNAAFQGFVTGDTQPRFNVQADGRIIWGPGGATSPDVNLYRNGVDVLKTDDNFQVVGTLNVTGVTTLGDLDITNSLDIGSARFRPLLSTTGTVANTTTETAIASLTIPANDAVVGAIYRIIVRAHGSVTATPTLTVRAWIGGTGGNRLTSATGIVLSSASNATNHPWHAELYYKIESTGAGGTGRAHLDVRDTLSLGGTVPFTGVRQGMDASLAAIGHNTTSSQDLVITVQWSAASTLNTTTAYIIDAARIA